MLTVMLGCKLLGSLHTKQLTSKTIGWIEFVVNSLICMRSDTMLDIHDQNVEFRHVLSIDQFFTAVVFVLT